MRSPVLERPGSGDVTRRTRAWIYLLPNAHLILDEIAQVQQEIWVRKHSKNLPRVILPTSPRDWYHSPDGYDAFLSLRNSGQFTDEKYQELFDDWCTRKKHQIENDSRLKNKFPLAHCAGAAMEKLLAKHGAEILREMQRELEEAKQD